MESRAATAEVRSSLDLYIEGAAARSQPRPRRAHEAALRQPGEGDLYRFQVTANGVYVIDTVGQTDVYLKLFGPNSPTALIDEDDDSGLGLNPLISAPLAPGEYYLQVRHYNRSSGTGQYSIGVRRR